MPSVFAKPLLLCTLLASTSFIHAGGNPVTNTQADFIKPYRAVYDANFDFFLPLEGTAVRELQQQPNGDWLLSHTIDSSLLTLNETSHFDWLDGSPKTLEYKFQQKTLGKDKNDHLVFDWSQHQLQFSSKDRQGEYSFPSDALDKLNYQLKLRQDLIANRELPSYAVTDRHNMKNYDFEIIGTEVLQTPMGKLNALQLKRIRDADAKRQTNIWLATDWDYLLVKIHQQEKGKSIEVVMIEGELDGQPIRGL